MNKNTVYRAVWHNKTHTYSEELGIFSTFEKAYERVIKDILENYDDVDVRAGGWWIYGYYMDTGLPYDRRLQFSIYDHHNYYEHTPEYIYNFYGSKEEK
jgi:hypothetical protein